MNASLLDKLQGSFRKTKKEEVRYFSRLWMGNKEMGRRKHGKRGWEKWERGRKKGERERKGEGEGREGGEEGKRKKGKRERARRREMHGSSLLDFNPSSTYRS